MTFQASSTNFGQFTGNYDIHLAMEMHLEQWNRDVPYINWKSLIRDPRLVYDSEYSFDEQEIQLDKFDAIDPLYQERVNPRYHPAIPVRVFVKEQGDEQTLTKLGIIESRPAIAKFSVPFLESLGLSARNVRIGDILEFNGHEYTIDAVIEDFESRWLNSNVPFMLLCKLNTIDRQGR